MKKINKFKKHSRIKQDTFIEELEEWEQELKYLTKTEHTYKTYINAIESFRKYILENDIKEIDLFTLRDYLEALKPSFSTNTINLRLVTLNRMFNALEYEDIHADLIKDTTSNVSTRVLTEADYNQLLEQAHRMGKEKIALLIETLAFTGMRISELQYLTREALKDRGSKKYNERYIKVTNKGKTRYVYIPKELNKKLLAYCRKNKIKAHKDKETGKKIYPVIFHAGNDETKLLDQSYIRKELKAIAGAISPELQEKAFPHNLRHYFSYMFSNTPGTNPFWLSDILGHTVTTVTGIYTRAQPADYLNAVDRMEEYFKKKK